MNVATTPNASSIVSKDRLNLRCMAEGSRVHTQLYIMAWYYDKGKIMPGKPLLLSTVFAKCQCRDEFLFFYQKFLECVHCSVKVLNNNCIKHTLLEGPLHRGPFPPLFQKTMFLACRLYTLNPKTNVPLACTFEINARLLP